MEGALNEEDLRAQAVTWPQHHCIANLRGLGT